MSVSKGGAGHSISGSWTGTYFYLGDASPCGFEVVFLEQNGLLDGNILDDSGGGANLGEAILSGTFSYPSVAFKKIYRNNGLDPIDYRGTMSEDGKMLSGTWVIKKSSVTGTWVARRAGNDEKFEFKETEDKIEQEAEKPKTLAVPGTMS